MKIFTYIKIRAKFFMLSLRQVGIISYIIPLVGTLLGHPPLGVLPLTFSNRPYTQFTSTFPPSYVQSYTHEHDLVVIIFPVYIADNSRTLELKFSKHLCSVFVSGVLNTHTHRVPTGKVNAFG